jgi:hypothetical protein
MGGIRNMEEENKNFLQRESDDLGQRRESRRDNMKMILGKRTYTFTPVSIRHFTSSNSKLWHGKVNLSVM